MTSVDAKFSWFIPFLGLLTALGPLSNELYVPSLPLVAAGLDSNGGAVQLTLSTLLLGLSGGALLYGPLSDQYGRKPVLAAGLTVYVVAGVLAALADSLAMLVIWRFLQGLGASSGSVLARTIVLDRWRGEQASRALSWIAIVSFLTAVLSPLVGGLIAMALGFVGVVPLIANSSWVFQDFFGLTPFQYGLCFSLIMLGGSAGAYTNSRFVRASGSRGPSASAPLRWLSAACRRSC